jgi:hypothetical protein
MELFLRVIRKRLSYSYRKDTNINDWYNNDKNNMLDDFILFANEERILSVRAQTVSNIPTGRFEDTIAEGPFDIRVGVDQRQFHCRIHGICNTFDLEGQRIDINSVQKNDNLRWLVHDTQKLKPLLPNQLTRVAWSAGCFVLLPSNLLAFNSLIDAYGIKDGHFIPGEVIMED